MTGPAAVLLTLLTLVSARQSSETPRSYRKRLTNEIRTGDVVALVLAFVGILTVTVYLAVFLVRRFRKKEPVTQQDKHLGELEQELDELDDDSIIKKDVSGRSAMSTAAGSGLLRCEDLIGALGAALVTACLVYYMMNQDDD